MKYFLSLSRLSLAFLVIWVGCQREVSRERLPIQEFEGPRALDHVAKLVAMGPRPSGSKEIANAQSYILRALDSVGLEGKTQEFEETTPRGTIRFKNLIAEIRGRSSQGIVVGTHYDTKYYPNSNFVGANDGGSGVGILLELARILARHKPAATVRLVFFDGEEAVEKFTMDDGLYGSRRWVAELVKSGDLKTIKAAVCLDMVGDRDLSVTLPSDSSRSLVKILFHAAERESVRGKFTYGMNLTDDYTSFLKAGIPAVDIIDFEFGSLPGGNDYWHTPQDTLDKVSAESLQITGQVTLKMLEELTEVVASGGNLQ